MDKKKKYVSPKIISILTNDDLNSSDAGVSMACTYGSSATEFCGMGAGAAQGCSTGMTAGSICYIGTSAFGCTGGSNPS